MTQRSAVDSTDDSEEYVPNNRIKVSKGMQWEGEGEGLEAGALTRRVWERILRLRI